MQNVFIFKVIFIFSLLRSSYAADVKNLCAYTQLASNGETHYSFLRTGQAMRLYRSAWSPQRALLSCSWAEDAGVTGGYLSLCREKNLLFSEKHSEHFNVTALFGTDLLCEAVNKPERTSSSRLQVQGVRALSERSGAARHLRVKRGFIVPGTLWCGAGNKALSYQDLGSYKKTDSCCRGHDQCQDTILSFETKFGVFNSNIFTMSHCDCDKRFHSCLSRANDSISNVVGYTFFNLLKMNCFELSYKVLCTERNWFGMCKATQTVLQAEVQPPTAYELGASAENASQAPGPPVTSDLSHSNGPRPDDLALVPGTSHSTGGDGNSVLAALAMSAASLTPAHFSNLDAHNLFTVKENPKVWEDLPANTSQELSCEVYRELDQCRARIPHTHRRYGLHNPEPRTLFHCSCTNRLFQILANQRRRLSDVDTFLLDQVSKSCFWVPDCGVGERSCKAIIQSPLLPKPERTPPAGDGEEWRHLLAARLRVRRPTSYRARRKHRAVRLGRLCDRITRATAHSTEVVSHSQNPLDRDTDTQRS